jgi:hypothetical protein
MNISGIFHLYFQIHLIFSFSLVTALIPHFPELHTILLLLLAVTTKRYRHCNDTIVEFSIFLSIFLFFFSAVLVMVPKEAGKIIADQHAQNEMVVL